MKKILIIISIPIVLYIGLYIYALFTPKLPTKTANSYYFYDKDNNLYPNYDDEWISINEINKNLINATISIEDKHFYNHIGFDYLRILKALYINFINHDRLEGASTITQQYAKNLFLDFDKTWKRKLTEAWLTIRLEVQYSKDDILEGYLNTINYGGVFGIERASKYYFNKSSKELNLAEASMLAGIPKSPSNYSPIENLENAKNRQKIVLNAMLNNKYITKEEYNEAINTELTYAKEIENKNYNSIMYYQQAVLDELESIKSIPSFLTTGGLKIYTNLDVEAQKTMENSVNKYYNDASPQVAGIMANSSTGEVIALIGGKDYKTSQFNRAINSKRAVGSTMKPILYYAALENGFTPSTTFTSEKTIFTFSNDQLYSPSNYDNTYPNQEISLVSAISHSDNIFAVKTHLFLGEETLVNTAKKLGIKEPLDSIPSLALGSVGMSLIDISRGYETLASGGYNKPLHFINKVEDINGNLLYEYEDHSELILDPSLTYILSEMLTSTTNSSFIDYSYPTCFGIASKLKGKYAIKSGTTDYDNLIIGYNKDYLLSFWSGYDNNDNIPASNSYNLKQAWADTMMYDNKNTWYDMPSDVIGVIIDPLTGKLASNESKKTIMYYLKGTEPK